MRALLKDMATRLPQAAATLLQDLPTSHMTVKVLTKLRDGITAHCAATAQAIGA
jgi:hypothetical protein